MATTFVGGVATAISRALAPLETGLQNEQAFIALLRRFGWDVSVSASSMGAVRGAFSVAALFQTVRGLVAQIEAGAANEVEIARQLVTAAGQLVDAIRALENVAPAGLPFPLDQAAFWSEVPPALVDELLCDFLEDSNPILYGALAACGLITIEQESPAGAGRVPYVRRVLHWDDLPMVVGDPVNALANTYRWNDGGQPFNHAHLLWVLELLLDAAGVTARREPPAAALTAPYYTAANAALASLRELDVPLFTSANEDWSSFTELGVLLLPIPPDGQPGSAPDGLLLTPLVKGVAGNATGLATSLTLTLEGGFETAAAFRAKIFPDGVALEGPTTIDAGLTLSGRPPSPYVLAGAPGSHRLEVGAFFASLRIQGPLADPEVIVEAGNGREPDAPRFAVVIQAADGDSFIRKFFGSEPQRVELGANLLWSSKTGLQFSGSLGIRLVIPLHLTIAVVRLETAVLALEATATGVDVFAAVTGGFQLGPVAASVDEIGATMRLQPVPAGQPRGAFGDLDATFGFKPPRGVGLVVDAAVVKGGGFLSLDYEKGEYAGALELSLKDQIQLKAIGILTTTLPGGQQGFSLLVIITAQFPPIQLSFGFTLNGVGGLIGINRTMLVDVLRAGIRNRTIDSIMFPPNPVQNAPKLISDLKAIFPPVEGRFVVGPMLEIGWGTPTLVTARIGVFIELPAPLRLAILGQIKARIPTEQAALVKLNLDAIGIVEFEKKSLSIDATLYDSEIVGFALSGDMALRLNWGDQPNFALSVGGLNPRFTPPPGFPELRRLALTMGSGNNPRLSLETYMALTSNSAQFGARLELRAEGGGFGLHGYLGFDALFIFSPFSFVTDMEAGVDLLRGSSVFMSIHLAFSLSGPRPWHAWGKASLKILFLTISVRFDVTWGEAEQVELPAIDALKPLLDALAEQGNWSAVLPRETELGVSLGEAAPSEKAVLVHPLGRLTVIQKVVPFNLTITKFGNAAPAGMNHFTVSKVTFNGSTRSHEYIEDFFAPGQFKELNDSDAISGASYTLMDGGLAAGTAAVSRGAPSNVKVLYSTQIIDDFALPADRVGIYRPDAVTFFAQVAQSAAARSPVRTSGEAKYVLPGTESAVNVAEVQYVIATTDDLRIRDDLSGLGGMRETAARERLERYLEQNPAERGNVQVVPRHETVSA